MKANSFCSDNYSEYKSNADRNKTLPVQGNINKISPYLKDIVNILKSPGTWKIQLTLASNFSSSTENDKEHVTHSKTDNIEIMINNKADEVVKELFDSLKNKYQNTLESMRGREFVFN